MGKLYDVVKRLFSTRQTGAAPAPDDRRGPAEVRYDELAETAKPNPTPKWYISWTWRW